MLRYECPDRPHHLRRAKKINGRWIPGWNDRIRCGWDSHTACYVCFRGDYCQQTFSTAMGSPVSVTVANLVMEEVEQMALSKFEPPPCFWKRCVDDTCTALPQNLVSSFHAHLNSINQRIQFMEKEGNVGTLLRCAPEKRWWFMYDCHVISEFMNEKSVKCVWCAWSSSVRIHSNYMNSSFELNPLHAHSFLYINRSWAYTISYGNNHYLINLKCQV